MVITRSCGQDCRRRLFERKTLKPSLTETLLTELLPVHTVPEFFWKEFFLISFIPDPTARWNELQALAVFDFFKLGHLHIVVVDLTRCALQVLKGLGHRHNLFIGPCPV